MDLSTGISVASFAVSVYLFKYHGDLFEAQ